MLRQRSPSHCARAPAQIVATKIRVSSGRDSDRGDAVGRGSKNNKPNTRENRAARRLLVGIIGVMHKGRIPATKVIYDA